ncbi:MAG: hypothetical protein J6W26_03565 [Bacteroidales bacterium]|nr:hypothetical protein [Bacteroidales bacterium]
MKRVRKSKTARRGTVMSVLGGSFLTREDFSKIFPFLVYLTVLLMLIITNAYIAESTSRAIKKNALQLRDLRVEYIYTKSAYTKESTQTIMIDKLAGDGLKESLDTRVVTENGERKTENGEQRTEQ